MVGVYLGYGYGYGMFFDPTYILIIIAAVISLAAQFKVQASFSKYSKIAARSGMTGARIAEMLLRSQGIMDVSVTHISGKLTDHYNPKNKTLALSDSVYNSTSVAAISVAAHECGHAIQHNVKYAPLSFRSSFVPIANIGSSLSWVFIIAGVLFSFNRLLITIGIVMFSLAVLFQLVTLPVEFNASARALELLKTGGFLYGDENKMARKVLTAAALTYVAAAATAILQFIRLIILFGGRDRD